jgi:hypothetical protein
MVLAIMHLVVLEIAIIQEGAEKTEKGSFHMVLFKMPFIL